LGLHLVFGIWYLSLEWDKLYVQMKARMRTYMGYSDGFHLHPAAVVKTFTALQSLSPARFRLAALIRYVVFFSRWGIMYL